ncbi:MAG: family 10 glycosylhydrolase [Clostridium sp.]|nr:family 10 glycosylhydrolase [Clostridium sp.]MCM1548302.1 family 10 glycosylhydrolase [Ruminococcus sp.]
MKKFIFLLLAAALMTVNVSCQTADSNKELSEAYDSEILLNEQTLEQLQVFEPTEKREKGRYERMNYDDQTGMWFTYMDYAEFLKGKSESEFKKNIASAFKSIKDLGVNTLYLHVRAFNDSYYRSETFPKGEYYDGSYDPLNIMTEEAHKLKLSVHAWINPLRCQTEEQIKKLDKNYTIKKWYDDKEKNGTYIVKLNDNFYLNPAYSEVRQYITDGVKEITENYDIDGIHIDDYFYPTTEESFDAAAFAVSGSSDLGNWRIGNIDKMVKEIYTSIKATDENILFGISPQGNISANYSSQYADVKKWISKSGYCDYITPQIYFGFENESCPFIKTVKIWQELKTSPDVRLNIGLCTYKIGNEDKWAGTGKNEWIENRDTVQKQIEYCRKNGFNVSLYSYASTFADEVKNERSDIKAALSS